MTSTSGALDTPAPGSRRSHQGALDTWPFWAPSEAAAVEAALDLAGVGHGDRLIDLGCGDGQVLLAAARRGATVAGVEADPELVDEAREHLAAASVDADIRAGDLFDDSVGLDADVFFSYLAPATLQRLLPRLAGHRGARLVTVDFDVPGLVPTRRADPARLYRLPGRRRPVGSAGWASTGTLVATVPECQSLSCIDLVHPGGTTDVRLSPEFDGAASVLAGADALDGPDHLAVDVRWEPMASGTVVAGVIESRGMPDHPLFVITTEDDEGMWELDAGAVDAIDAALRAGATTLAELLDATVR